MTKTKSSSVAQMSRSPARRSAQVWRGAAGRKFGRTLPMITTVIMSMVAASRPGMMPAMNSLPMSCSVMMP